MSESQAGSQASRFLIGGALSVFVGVVMAVVFALQPWRSCPEDDVAAGCVALPQDTAGLLLGLAVFSVGLVLLCAGVRFVRRGT